MPLSLTCIIFDNSLSHNNESPLFYHSLSTLIVSYSSTTLLLFLSSSSPSYSLPSTSTLSTINRANAIYSEPRRPFLPAHLVRTTSTSHTNQHAKLSGSCPGGARPHNHPIHSALVGRADDGHLIQRELHRQPRLRPKQHLENSARLQ